MDLRRRLVGYLGGLLLSLLLMAVLVNLYTLRHDVNNEIVASEQLVTVLLDIGNIGHDLPSEQVSARLAAILSRGVLRHVTVSAADADTIPVSAHVSFAGKLARYLGVTSGNDAGQLVNVAGQRLRIAPNPVSEIEERLTDTVHFCITLMLFSGATLLVAWWSTHHALAPVRDLEAGLQRLAKGETDAALPVFVLREFTQVAAAIDELAAALSTSREAQRQLSDRLIRVQEDERRDLAMDLHDEMGQTLTAISVTAAYLERNAARLDATRVAECALELRHNVRASGSQLRAMLKRLQPYGLDALKLNAILQELLSGWQQSESGMSFILDMQTVLPVLSENISMVLYRVVQEAVTNVVRHSGATQCRVVINTDADTLHLMIEDNGCGFPEHGARYGCGLLGMQQRIQMVGGTLVLNSKKSADWNYQKNYEQQWLDGLLLHVRLPLPQSPSPSAQQSHLLREQ